MDNGETDPFHLVSDFTPQRRVLTDAEHYKTANVCRLWPPCLYQDFIFFMLLFQGLDKGLLSEGEDILHRK